MLTGRFPVLGANFRKKAAPLFVWTARVVDTAAATAS
jgi:hypothetical protein